MYKVQTFNKIAPVGLNLLNKDKYDISEGHSDPDGIILRSHKLHDMNFPKSIKGIARAGAGTNNIPVEKCSEQGIVVFNTPGANANGVKELVITGLLLSSRKVIDGINWAKSLVGSGEDVAKAVEKGKSNYAGPEIKGKTLGVIGLGAIGVMTANSASALGMNVIGFDPYMSVEAAWGLSRNVKKAADLNSLISDSDYISINVPLNDKTRGMINKEKFDMMKDGVRILNFSRAALVDTKDLKTAIESGKVACYVTDFPDEEVLKLNNVIGMPHLGASTPESEDNCAIMAAEQMKDFLENGNIKNSVNYPNCILARGENTKRLAMMHKNVPNMVGQITQILAEDNLNIDEMVNKSKGDFAYTLIDVHNGSLKDNIVNKLEKVEGMLRVTIL